MSKKNGAGGKPITLFSDDEIAAQLSMQYRVPTIRLDAYEVDPAVIALVPRDLCERHGVVPVSRAGSSLIVAMSDPTNRAALDALAAHTGMKIEVVIATETAIRASIERSYGASR